MANSCPILGAYLQQQQKCQTQKRKSLPPPPPQKKKKKKKKLPNSEYLKTTIFPAWRNLVQSMALVFYKRWEALPLRLPVTVFVG